MRKQINLSPNRYNPPKTSGSNKFVSTFKSKESGGSVVEKSTSYNWIGYKTAIVFTIVIGLITYLVFENLIF